jgi:hypothetical protein
MASDNLGQQAYRVVEQLSAGIGPRPTGSASEQRALDYVESELRQACAEVRRMTVSGIPGPSNPKVLLLIGGLFLAYTTYLLVYAPEAVWLFLIAFFTLPRLISAVRKRASASSPRQSTNVIGHLPAAQESRACAILCAHLDSAKASRFPGESWARLNHLFFRALGPFVLLMAVVATLRWLDIRLGLVPLAVWYIARAFGVAASVLFVLFQLTYIYISRGDLYSPGANDNASGVGVVLALARHFQQLPLAHLDTYYILFTAEEVGLVGSERFVHQTVLPRDGTFVFNLDMVGTGNELCYVRGSGPIPLRLTDNELNALLRQAYPEIKRHFYFMGDSDFSPFAAKGFRTASLCTQGGSHGDLVYHTDRDTVEYVDVAPLQLTANTVSKAIRLLDQRLG